MKTKRNKLKIFSTARLLIVCAALAVLPKSIKAQDGIRYAASLQGGPNFFLSDAYPDDIVSASFSATFDFQPYNWIGFMLKAENGKLSGTKRYKSGRIPFSTESNYILVSTLGYLHATNIVFGVDDDRWIDIKIMGGPGYISSKYDVTYEEGTKENRLGTANALALSAGGILELKLSPQFVFLMELNGIADFSNSIDGIWDDNQGAAEYKGYDIVATFEVGLKYTFGESGPKTKGKKRKRSSVAEPKNLPSQYKEFRGFDGMEKNKAPKY